jgi:VIT1/CCC1 family predicted Fe2+/Mn2+ transporter
MNPNLKLIGPEEESPKSARKVSAKRSKTEINAMGVVEQIQVACRPENCLATLMGGAFGAVVPSFAYCISHLAITATTPMPLLASYLVIVAGALLFSAPTVYEWTARAFFCKRKALGFVALIELVLITPMPEILHAMPYVALGYLIFVNSVATGTKLALRK